MAWYTASYKQQAASHPEARSNGLLAGWLGSVGLADYVAAQPASSLGAASCEHGNRYGGKGLSFFKNSSGRNSNIWIYNRLNLIDLSERRSYLSSPIGRSDRKKI
ncbi:MAG: hypothetical protein VXU42_06345 [Verrucomicrobiota bacterium]|nr:hypothetical protein [Verrucomicrobiota bacterium]